MASSSFNIRENWSVKQHTGLSGYTSSSYVTEYRNGNIVVVDFVLNVSSAVPTESGYSNVCTLDFAKYAGVANIAPLSSSYNPPIDIRIENGILQRYAFAGWNVGASVRGQLIARM